VCVGDASPYELCVTECNEESGVLLLHGVFGCLCVWVFSQTGVSISFSIRPVSRASVLSVYFISAV